MMQGVYLVPFNPSRDMPTVAAWLRQPHVAQWWGDQETILNELISHPINTQALIQIEGRSIGYLCWQTLTHEEIFKAGLSDLPTASRFPVDRGRGIVNHFSFV